MDAREGQITIEVGCNCDHTVLVAEHALPTWRCGKCRCKAGPTGRQVVLGSRGALPAGWRDQPIIEGAAA